MKTASWFFCYPDKLLADTFHLSAHDFGAYVRSLLWYYLNGPLPNNDDTIRTIMRVEPGAWEETKKNLLALPFYSLNGDGKWHQKRADKEILRREEHLAKRQKQTLPARLARGLSPSSHDTTHVTSYPDTSNVTSKSSGGMAQMILYEKELERVEERMRDIRQAGTLVAGDTMRYTIQQASQMKTLRERKAELVKLLGFAV